MNIGGRGALTENGSLRSARLRWVMLEPYRHRECIYLRHRELT